MTRGMQRYPTKPPMKTNPQYTAYTRTLVQRFSRSFHHQHSSTLYSNTSARGEMLPRENNQRLRLPTACAEKNSPRAKTFRPPDLLQTLQNETCREIPYVHRPPHRALTHGQLKKQTSCEIWPGFGRSQNRPELRNRYVLITDPPR
jgi:hypothetical protein